MSHTVPITAPAAARRAAAAAAAAPTPTSAIDRAIETAPAAMRDKVRISTGEVMDTLRCSRGSVWRFRREGRLSDPIYAGRRQALWLASDVMRILAGEA